MHARELIKTENISVSRRVSVTFADTKGKPQIVFADASKSAPSEFELLQVGMWRTPWHGDIMIMPGDLTEYVANYEAGFAVSGNSKLKLPINFGHDQGGKAAGWFVPKVVGDTLMATEVEWTPAAQQALADGEWKCISAEFCPAGRGGWIDPLDSEHVVDNVLEGAALTNIPLYANLEPVMASASFGKSDTKPEVFLITANKETQMPTLEEVVAKDPATLTEEEKTFLTDSKDQLTDEQKKTFGFEVIPKVENKKEEIIVPAPIVPEPAAVVEPEAAAIAADIKSGKSTVISADRLSRLETTADAYENEMATKVVMAHVARGAIKADAISKWVEQVRTDQKRAEELLKSIPDNKTLADAIGAEADDESIDTRERITNLAKSKVEASQGKLSIQEAMKQATSEVTATNKK